MNVGRSGLWRPTVQPYLEELGEQLLELGVSEHSVAVTVAGVRLLVTPLEQELVMEMMGDGQQSFARRHVLVRDGLGLRIKLRSELTRLAEVDPSERDELLNQLNSDVGLGCQLMHEITQEMNAITSVGDISEAKAFSAYRQQLVKIVSEAERLVSGGKDSSGRQPVLPKTGYARPLMASSRGHGGSAAKHAGGKAAKGTAAGKLLLRWAWIVLPIAGAAIGALWWFLI